MRKSETQEDKSVTFVRDVTERTRQNVSWGVDLTAPRPPGLDPHYTLKQALHLVHVLFKHPWNSHQGDHIQGHRQALTRKWTDHTERVV